MSKGRAVGMSSDEEQGLLLEEAKKRVNVEAFYMKRCLDSGKLMDALKHASNMIGQLRTSLLSPKNYYVLYIAAFDELRYLENYLNEEKKRGERMSKLYELVQYAGNILPRLYLLVTVGSVYISSGEAPAKDVLRDLVEMCKGVQHPTRGLFLRNYLSEMTKDKLPDVGTEGEGGTVEDSVEFAIQNFTEMNKLWVRMQHQGTAAERARREKEREELRLLVGKNLARLSQLEGVDVTLYQDVVLPRIMEQIVNCKDKLAQQYLMECVIQVFPDEFHLKTLGYVLSQCRQLIPEVDAKSIIVALINRLAQYSQRQPSGMPSDLNVFDVFFEQFQELTASQSSMPLEHVLQLQAALMNLSMSCYPSNLDNVDKVLLLCSETLEKFKDSAQLTKHVVVKETTNILTLPLDTYKNVITVLKLQNYSRVMAYLTYTTRKRVSKVIAENARDNNTRLENQEQVERLFDVISPLLADDEDASGDSEIDTEDLEEEQGLVASLVHLFHNDELNALFAMYGVARKAFTKEGPTMSHRIKHTLPPLVFGAIRLAERVRALGEEMAASSKKVYKYIHETLKFLVEAERPELALRLYLQAASSAARADFEEIAYEFFTQAFILYEEQLVSDNAAQVRALQMITGALYSAPSFDKENYETLITKCAGHASKLLKKWDQARGVYMCSHLFWREGTHEAQYKDDKRVLECLQRSLKIADKCMESSMNVRLFVEILNQYLFYFLNHNEAITVKYLNSLIALINTNMSNMEQSTDTSEIRQHFTNTIAYIEFRKNAGADDQHASFDAIVV
eukprot:TRINITY_DN1533_c0_g1_i1.p1 TRINITY_DN1533_c0_g1~~TRINITY_DN1533_c0_g1_i1.p1  ORF type:complete len:793 (+),score=389.42 TRINITY_DN1533_c0_g1_i1:139-2517(+)